MTEYSPYAILLEQGEKHAFYYNRKRHRARKNQSKQNSKKRSHPRHLYRTDTLRTRRKPVQDRYADDRHTAPASWHLARQARNRAVAGGVPACPLTGPDRESYPARQKRTCRHSACRPPRTKQCQPDVSQKNAGVSVLPH